MSSICYACKQQVDTMASRCPHCTSELNWFGNDPRPQPDYFDQPGAFGVFVKCCIAVALVMWLVTSCYDHYYCDPAHETMWKDADWRKKNCN